MQQKPLIDTIFTICYNLFNNTLLGGCFMFCTNCGNNVKKRESSCMHCGALKNTGISYCSKCSTPLRGATVCPSCGTSLNKTTPPHASNMNENHYTAGKGDGYDQVNANNKTFNQKPTIIYEGAEKKKMVALMLAIFLGALGIHNFYLGYHAKGVRQILFTLIFHQIGYIWGWIDAYKIYNGTLNTDSDGVYLK